MKGKHYIEFNWFSIPHWIISAGYISIFINSNHFIPCVIFHQKLIISSVSHFEGCEEMTNVIYFSAVIEGPREVTPMVLKEYTGLEGEMSKHP